MAFLTSLVRIVLVAPIVLAPALAPRIAAAQTLIAPGIDGGGTSLDRGGGERHSVSIGQLGASGALLDSNDRPRLVGGIGGVLVAETVPEPGTGSAIALAILGLTALRPRRSSTRRHDARNGPPMQEDRS